MAQKRLAVGGESDTGIPAKQCTIGIYLVFAQNLQCAIQAVEVNYTGGLVGNRLIQRFLSVLTMLPISRTLISVPLQSAVKSNAAVLEFG